ncbi:hypothetical protein CVT25_006073, partial [Psilocybe cyanescens]
YGDWYRGCSHFVKSYYSGNRTDCKSQYCALSSAHVHTARICPCPKVKFNHLRCETSMEANDDRRIVSMFHKPCEDCRAAEFARRVGR